MYSLLLLLSDSSRLSRNEVSRLRHHRESPGEASYDGTGSLDIFVLPRPLSFIVQLRMTFEINTSPLTFKEQLKQGWNLKLHTSYTL